MELIVFSGVVSAALLVLEARDYLQPEFPRRATGSSTRLRAALAQRESA
jgi:hypothetical protein